MAQVKLVALKGLSGSGKSTFAKKLQAQGFIRTNKDEIREQLYGENYKRKDEKQVLRVRNAIIEDALSHNRSVVVDDTNLNPVHVKDLANLAKKYDAIFEVDDGFLGVAIEVCIKRDLKRLHSVGEGVIRQQFAQYIKKPITAKEYDPNLPMAVIVDIDGTLAHMMDKRKPYEWHKVGGDEADAGVAHLVDAIGIMNYATVFLFSGRDEECRPETEKWLEQNDIEYKKLVMRPAKSMNDDREVKAKMYEDEIVDKYNVLFVVDDRPKVCRMWRDELGLRVLQVGDPHYDF